MRVNLTSIKVLAFSVYNCWRFQQSYYLKCNKNYLASECYKGLRGDVLFSHFLIVRFFRPSITCFKWHLFICDRDVLC